MLMLISILVLLLGMSVGAAYYMICGAVPDTLIYLPTMLICLYFILQSVLENHEGKRCGALLIALIIRFAIMLWNVYGRDVFTLPGVGTDTEGFYASAVTISSNLQLLNMPIYGGVYSKYLGIVYSFTGPSYLVGSFLNYIYSAFTVLLFEKIVNSIAALDADDRMRVVLMYAFLPNFMIIGSSLRREPLMILFTMLSLQEILLWLKTYDLRHGLFSLLFIVLGSLLHSGVIGLSAGYFVLLMFYNPASGKWQFRRDAIIAAVLLAAGVAIILLRYRTAVLGKILTEDEETFVHRANRAVGDTAYLKNIQLNSYVDVLKYLPLKFLYFIIAPTPWDWRGIADAVAFALDALAYLWCIKYTFTGLKRARSFPALFAIALSTLACLIIYAIGCQNSANAMRHRMKAFGPMLIVMCLERSFEIGSTDISGAGHEISG